jgi:hypothetical protein
VVAAAVCLAAAPSLAEPPASIPGAAQERARDSFARFAQAWMDKVQRLAAEERRNPTIRPGAAEAVVTYRGYGEDFSVELRPTGHPDSPFVGLLRYSELLYTCTDPKASDCTVASSVPVTEIFRFQEGRWIY